MPLVASPKGCVIHVLNHQDTIHENVVPAAIPVHLRQVKAGLNKSRARVPADQSQSAAGAGSTKTASAHDCFRGKASHSRFQPIRKWGAPVSQVTEQLVINIEIQVALSHKSSSDCFSFNWYCLRSVIPIVRQDAKYGIHTEPVTDRFTKRLILVSYTCLPPDENV